ncbi:MAG: hypothetical protein ACLQVF_36175 [Isosphaeraceae bacterium]
MAPKFGLRAKVDWEQAYNHYSKDESFRARAFRSALMPEMQDGAFRAVLEDLIGVRAVQLEVIGDEDNLAKIQRFLQPLLWRINEEILVRPALFPNLLLPGATGQGDGGGMVDLRWGPAMKPVGQVKRGSESIDFHVHQAAQRVAALDGFLNFSKLARVVRVEVSPAVSEIIVRDEALTETVRVRNVLPAFDNARFVQLKYVEFRLTQIVGEGKDATESSAGPFRLAPGGSQGDEVEVLFLKLENTARRYRKTEPSITRWAIRTT